MSTFPTDGALRALVRDVNDGKVEDGLFSVQRALVGLLAYREGRSRKLPRVSDTSSQRARDRRDGRARAAVLDFPEHVAIRTRTGGHWATLRGLVEFPEQLDAIVRCETVGCGVFVFDRRKRAGRRRRFCERCGRLRRRATKAESMARARGGRKRQRRPRKLPRTMRIVWESNDGEVVTAWTVKVRRPKVPAFEQKRAAVKQPRATAKTRHGRHPRRIR